MRLTTIIGLTMCATLVAAQEEITQPTPTPAAVAARLRLAEVRLRFPAPDATGAVPLVAVTLYAIGEDGACLRDGPRGCSTVEVGYHGDEAVVVLNMIQRGDFTAQSLTRRLYQRLVADGKLASGTVSGGAAIPTTTPTAVP